MKETPKTQGQQEPMKPRTRWLLIGGIGLTALAIIGLIVMLVSRPGPTGPTTSTTAGTATGTTAGTTVRSLDQESATAMVGYGLMPTEADGSIQPDQAVSRAEFARLLTEVLQIGGNVPNQPSFADVLPNHPQYAAIEAVKNLFGYQKPVSPTGTGGQTSQAGQKFLPDQPVTCSEAINAIASVLKLTPAASALADAIKLPADDPLRQAGNQELTRKDAARLFYLLINSRLPTPAPSFAIQGVH
jgi:hypothetical protein